MKVYEIKVRNCARCQQEHESVQFVEFRSPPENWNMWAMCPTVNEPILLSVQNIEP